MHTYLVNFVIWWYLVLVKEWNLKAIRNFMFHLERTNTLAMAQNLFVPLFQDNSGAGKFISFPIRLAWVWIGGMTTVFLALPLFVVCSVLFVLPIVVVLRFVLLFIPFP